MPRIRLSPPGGRRKNVLLRNIICSPMRPGIRRERTAGFRIGTCFERPPLKGRLADIDQHRLVGDDQPAVAVPPPVLMATGRAVMAGSPWVSPRECGDGRFRRLDQRQGIANGERMLGIPTPNFCDASSEFDGSTTTGHPNDRRRRGVMRFVMLASRPQRGQHHPVACRRQAKARPHYPPAFVVLEPGSARRQRVAYLPARSDPVEVAEDPGGSVPSSSDHWPAWLTKVARPPLPGMAGKRWQLSGKKISQY